MRSRLRHLIAAQRKEFAVEQVYDRRSLKVKAASQDFEQKQ
jgi:hypothetical protein